MVVPPEKQTSGCRRQGDQGREKKRLEKVLRQASLMKMVQGNWAVGNKPKEEKRETESNKCGRRRRKGIGPTN